LNYIRTLEPCSMNEQPNRALARGTVTT